MIIQQKSLSGLVIKSVIEYITLSRGFLQFIILFQVFTSFDSDHLPLTGYLMSLSGFVWMKDCLEFDTPVLDLLIGNK